MDPERQFPSQDIGDTKAEFRRPSNDAANRKYRRRSPVSGSSSSSDGSPRPEHSSSPINSKENLLKDSDVRRRKGDGRDMDKDSGRNHLGRSSVSSRYSGHHSLRGSHDYRRRDDHERRDRHRDVEERNYSKSHTDRARRESDYYRSRDHLRNDDKHHRDRGDYSGHRSRDRERETLSTEYERYKDSTSDRAGSGRRNPSSINEDTKSGDQDRHGADGDNRDERTDYRRSLGDHKHDHSPFYEEPRGHRSDANSRKNSDGHPWKEGSKSASKEADDHRSTKEEKKEYKYWETSRNKDQYNRDQGEQLEDRTALTGENPESPAKKTKFLSLDKGTADYNKKNSKFTTIADEGQSSSLKQREELDGRLTVQQALTADDIDAAKVAAMKVAESVNRNLIGTGFMTADQKKKLLWGSKKNTAIEEPAHRWDTSLFSDHERQEKFNKLMGVKGELRAEQKPDNPDQAEKQREVQLDLEKQYTAGLRRRDGRTVGLGL